MRKKLSMVLASALLLGSIITVANAASETKVGESNAGKKSNWTHLSDDYLKLLEVNTENPILFNRLQDRDYKKIRASLVDDNAVPMSKEEMDKLKADPDANVVDNLLPDGRYLKENWVELENKMVESAVKVKSLHIDKTISEVQPQEFEASINTANGKSALKMKELQVDGKTISIPKNTEGLSKQFTITPDGKKSIVYTNDGLWVVEPSNKQLKKISSETFKGKTYEDLRKTSVDLFGQNNVVWNDSVMPGPDSNKMVYVSNKNNLKVGSSALFAFDLSTGVETLIAETEGSGYLVNGWLTSDSIIAEKISNTGIVTQVLVGVDGSVHELKLAGESPSVYAVQDGLIAYATFAGSGEIHVAKVDQMGAVEELSVVQMKGTTRIRSGQGFSPKNKYVAFIYVPDDNPTARYLKVLDLKTNEVIDIDQMPDATTSSAAILEFSWINDKSLLAVIVEDKDGVNTQSSWTYSVGRGEANEQE